MAGAAYFAHVCYNRIGIGIRTFNVCVLRNESSNLRCVLATAHSRQRSAVLPAIPSHYAKPSNDTHGSSASERKRVRRAPTHHSQGAIREGRHLNMAPERRVPMCCRDASL